MYYGICSTHVRAHKFRGMSWTTDVHMCERNIHIEHTICLKTLSLQKLVYAG